MARKKANTQNEELKLMLKELIKETLEELKATNTEPEKQIENKPTQKKGKKNSSSWVGTVQNKWKDNPTLNANDKDFDKKVKAIKTDRIREAVPTELFFDVNCSKCNQKFQVDKVEYMIKKEEDFASFVCYKCKRSTNEI